MSGAPPTVAVVPLQRLPAGRLEEELGKADELRDPPVLVWAWLLLDGREWAGVLHGWAADPNGADDGLRGLVVVHREFAAGFWVESVHWVPAERVRQQED